MVRFSVGLSLDSNTVTKIDALRGLVPRSRFVEKILLVALEKEE